VPAGDIACAVSDAHAIGSEDQRLVVVTAQITATISAHAGYWGRNANMTTALHSARDDRDHPAPCSAGQEADAGPGDDHP
jgi:hypothetical protein